MTAASSLSPRRSLAVLLLLALLGIWGAGCSSSQAPQAAKKDPDIHKGPVLEDMTARIYNLENLESIVQAKRAVFDLSKTEALMYDVKVSFYREGEWGGDLLSKNGIMYLKEQPKKNISKHDILLEGTVSYKDKDGMTFTAPQLRYSGRSGRLVADGGPFEQRREMDGTLFILRGDSFSTDKDLTRFEGKGARLTIRSDSPAKSREQQNEITRKSR